MLQPRGTFIDVLLGTMMFVLAEKYFKRHDAETMLLFQSKSTQWRYSPETYQGLAQMPMSFSTFLVTEVTLGRESFTSQKPTRTSLNVAG